MAWRSIERQAMSIKLMTRVWETSIPSAEKMVLLVIADHANDDGMNAWPGIATIARKCSISERSAQRHVRSLEALGVIVVHRQAGGNEHTRGDRRPNRYDIDLAVLDGVTICHDDADGVTDTTERGDKSSATGCQMRHNGVTSVSPYPSINHPEPPVETHDDWLDFWRNYPRSEGKVAAQRAWRKMSAQDRADALATLPVHVLHWRARQIARTYIPHASTWLNGRRWEDDLGDPAEDMPLTKRIARFALEADKLNAGGQQ